MTHWENSTKSTLLVGRRWRIWYFRSLEKVWTLLTKLNGPNKKMATIVVFFVLFIFFV